MSQKNGLRKNRIFFHLLRNILIFTFIPLLGLAFYNYHYTIQSLKRNSEKFLKKKAVHQGDLLGEMIGSKIEMLRVWSRLRTIRTNIESDDAEGDISKFLWDSTRCNPCFAFVDCINADGVVVASSLANHVSTESKPKSRKKEPSPIQFRIEKEKLFLIIQSPIHESSDQKGEVLGYLIGHYSLHGMVKKLTQPGRDAHLLLSYRNYQLTAKKLQPFSTKEHRSILRGEITNYTGDHFLALSQVNFRRYKLADPLYLLALQDKDDVFKGITKLAVDNGKIVFGVLIIIVLATILIARQFTAPLFKMSALIKEITRERNFKKRLSIERNDEIGDLANQFDSLCETLDHHKSLQTQMTSLVREIMVTRTFDKRLNIQGDDELGELARQFDSMCEFLEKYHGLQIEERIFLEKLTKKTANASRADVLLLGFQEVIKQTGAQTAILYIKNDQGLFQPEKWEGVMDKKASSFSYKLGESMVGQTALRKAPLLIQAPKEAAHLAVDTGIASYPPSCVLLIPIVYQGTTVAVFAVGRLGPFDEKGEKMARFIANQLSIGYDSALKAESLRQRAEEIEQRNQEISTQQVFLKKLNEELALASQHKSDFLSSMSHELRTPLNAMIGYTSMVLDDCKESLSANQYQNLQNAHSSSKLLLQLINDVLDFSKIEAGKMEVFLEELDLDDVLKDCLVTARGYLKSQNRDVELIWEVPDNLPPLKSDYTKLKQICNNLLSNAIKFTSAGHVKLAVQVTKDSLVLTVEDTGCGIPQDKISYIFESFRQMDDSIKKRFGGTGLGMAITKRLCERLGIPIEITSEEEKGTTFTLSLPLPLGNGEVTSEKTVQTEDQEKGPPNSGDNQDQRRDNYRASPSIFADLDSSPAILYMGGKDVFASLQTHLQDLPFALIQADNLEDCICQCTSLSLVWAIVVEPNGRGFELLRHLKEQPTTREIPVIVCSAKLDEYVVHLGSLECLSKPVTKEELLGTLLRVTRVKGGTILVVDDRADIRELYGEILAGAGYVSFLAESGEEALEILNNGPLPQALMIDLLMPGIDGFELLDHIKKHPAWNRIPVVVVTGKDLTNEERELLKKGSALLLQKGNFPPSELSQHIDSIVKSVVLGGIRSILVVDDNEMNLHLLSAIFEKAGYMVCRATTGKEALQIAETALPDIIFMDLAMPEMDGFEATRQIKANLQTAHIPIIACSAFALEEYRDRAYQAGCEAYITKPIEPKIMLEEINKYTLISIVKRRIQWQKSS